jgi:hypothetical protein
MVYGNKKGAALLPRPGNLNRRFGNSLYANSNLFFEVPQNLIFSSGNQNQKQYNKEQS